MGPLGTGIRGEPELFLRRSLLFSAESICCCDAAGTLPGRPDGGTPVVGLGEVFVLLSIEMTDGLGLKVTFRPFRCASIELGFAVGRRGVVSLVLAEAIVAGLGWQCSTRIINVEVQEP